MIAEDEYSLDMANGQLHQFWILNLGNFWRFDILKIQLQRLIQGLQRFFFCLTKTGNIHIQTLGNIMFPFFPND